MDTFHGYLNFLEELKNDTKKELVIQKLRVLLTEHYKQQSLTHLDVELLNRERQNISLELHDNLGSIVSTLKLLLQDIKGNDEIVENLNVSISSLYNSIRSISHSLNRNQEELGFSLKEALFNLERNLIFSKDLQLDMSFEKIEEISNSQLEINIFRILQELISNIINHSKANKAKITLKYSAPKFIMIVSDNGIGIKKSNNSGRRGIGLKNINSRVGFYNGKVNIDSTEESGTTVTIEIPIISSRNYKSSVWDKIKSKFN